MKFVTLTLSILLACCHANIPKPVAPSAPPLVHPTNDELAGASVDLADICLGIMDKSAPEIAQIFDLLKHCRDVGIPEAEGSISCGHFACNHIRLGKLLDHCPPREMHPHWMDETKL